jgi:hypothetical protein
MHGDGEAHQRLGIRPLVPVVAAVMTASELVGAARDEFDVACVAGIEIACRLRRGLTDAHLERGWDVVGTVGHVAAAAAAATLMRLSPPEWCSALAIAATQAAGHRAQKGTMAMALHSGKAASDAVEAALLAERGFTGPRSSIDGPRGLAALLSSDADVLAMVSDLGATWETSHAMADADTAGADFVSGILQRGSTYADFVRRVRPSLGEHTDALWTATATPDGTVGARAIFALSCPGR